MKGNLATVRTKRTNLLDREVVSGSVGINSIEFTVRMNLSDRDFHSVARLFYKWEMEYFTH